MEQTIKKNLRVLTKFTDAQFVKMVTKLLLSLSVFSFMFSQSSSLSFLPSLNFCLSTFPYQLFTHTMDKNCMFLLCNGLLVFLAKYSGLIKSLSLSSHLDESDSKHMIVDASQSDQLPTMLQKRELLVSAKEVGVKSNIIGLADNIALEEEGNDKETETEKLIFEDKEHEQGIEFEDLKDSNEDDEEEKALTHVAEDIDEEEEHIDWSDEFEEEDEEEEEEEEEAGNGKLSTEELNKKFEEFIRRMKEELRIEAQRQLIMV